MIEEEDQSLLSKYIYVCVPMSKGMRKLSSWIEVAPAPVIFPKKPSNTPTLETITEEAAEDFENDEISYNKRSSPCSN